MYAQEKGTDSGVLRIRGGEGFHSVRSGCGRVCAPEAHEDFVGCIADRRVRRWNSLTRTARAAEGTSRQRLDICMLAGND